MNHLSDTSMQDVPPHFEMDHLVVGAGFLSRVWLRGRATCTEEFRSTGVYGVNPGGLAQNGADLESAYANFRRGIVRVLFDLAEGADGIESFGEAVSSFLDESDDESVSEWAAARQATREGHDPGAGLRREQRDLGPEPKSEVLAASTVRLSPAVNILPETQRALAA